jgi:hypothetical protein
MAAITVLDTFGGAEDPLSTDWTTALNDGWLETGGVARPVTYATESAISWTTAFTEVAGGVSTDTQGLKVRVSLGALTAGSELRIYYRATNADDVTSDRYYWKIKKGSLAINSVVDNDEIELWKIVSTTHTQVLANQYDSSSANKYKAQSLGDLRNYILDANSIVTLYTCDDQHWITLKATERFGITSGGESEFIHQQYVDSGVAASGGQYVGLWSMDGSHTNSVKEIAAELFVAKYVDSGSGSDSNQGSKSHPYATEPKLIANVAVGEVGFIEGGTYSDHVYYHSISPTPASGTSWEDQIIFTAVWGSTQAVRNARLFIIRDTGSKNFRYIRWHGIRAQNVGSQGWRIDSQTSGEIPKYISIQNCTGNGCTGSGFFSTPQVANPEAVGGFEGFYHWIDNIAYDNGGPDGRDHGFYCNAKGQIFEYNQAYENGGDGIKNGFATRNTAVDDDCVVRDNLVYGNVAGLNIHTSTNHRVYNNISHTNSTGLFMFGSTYDAIIFNNLLYWNADGVLMRASLDPDVNGTNKGGTSTGHVLYNNVFFENTTYGVRLDGIPDTIDLQNNVFRSNTNGDYVNDSTADGSATNITFDYNNEATDTGVAGTNGVLGAPGFTSEVTPDFYPTAPSGMIDQGADLSGTIPALDAIGRPRPQGAGWEIGAFEYIVTGNDPVNTLGSTMNITEDMQTAIPASVADVDNDLATIVITVDEGIVNVTLSGAATAT